MHSVNLDLVLLLLMCAVAELGQNGLISFYSHYTSTWLMGIIIDSRSRIANHYSPHKQLDTFHSTHVWKTLHTKWEASRFVLCSPGKSSSIVISGSQTLSETVGRLVELIYLWWCGNRVRGFKELLRSQCRFKTTLNFWVEHDLSPTL